MASASTQEVKALELIPEQTMTHEISILSQSYHTREEFSLEMKL